MRPFIALPLLVLAFAGCGGGSQPSGPAATLTAYNTGWMARTERTISEKITNAVVQRGFNVIGTTTDCSADSARKFTCRSTSRVPTGIASRSCYAFASEQHGTIDAQGNGSWQSAFKGRRGVVPCR